MGASNHLPHRRATVRPISNRRTISLRPTGSGATIAIVDAYDDPNAASDLATYRSTYGLPTAKFKKVNQRGEEGNYPTADSGWAGEIALDIEAVSAVYPDANILLVEADSASGDDLYAAVDEAVQLGATVVSNSWGGSESSGETADDAHFHHPGVGIFVSSGDDGFEAGASSPASSQYVTAVGGTKLTKDSSARGWTETVWNSNNGANAGGSGVSKYEPKPSWQTDSASKRTVADVSAVGYPSFAVYDTYGGSGWAVYGGTSLSSPLVAAIFALTGKGSADASIIYNNTSAFYDVTSGNNRIKSRTKATYVNTAAVGYDGPTGWGTPNATALASAE
ncbi:MAG TPA: S53 family peptidase [Gemmatimonadaceae bacterium]|nr:S53 family peptidase [Gemmatimonadaceae bacterium]